MRNETWKVRERVFEDVDVMVKVNLD